MNKEKMVRTLTKYSCSPFFKDISNVVEKILPLMSNTVYFRLGFAPEDGCSVNHHTGTKEKGVSMWDIDIQEMQELNYSHLYDRPLCIYKGRKANKHGGSDYEPIISKPTLLAVIERKDSTLDGWGMYVNPELKVEFK